MRRRPARGAVRRLPALAAILVVVAALAGCVAAPGPRPTPTGLAVPNRVEPLVALTIPGVITYCPVVDAVHDDSYSLPTDQVYICRADGHHDSDGVSTYGPWESASRVKDPSALLAAYRVENDRRATGGCPLSRRDPMLIWVKRDGVTRSYYAPVDGCGTPTRAATTAYQDAKRELLIDFDRGTLRPSLKDPNG